MTTTSTTTNPYLALREAKIARNNKRLRELGLLNDPVAVSPVHSEDEVRGRSKKRLSLELPGSQGRRWLRIEETIKVERNNDIDEAMNGGGTPTSHRRSTRLKERTNKEKEQGSIAEMDSGASSSRLPAKPKPNYPVSSTRAVQLSSCPPNAARALDISAERLCIHPCDGLLGRIMEKTGKAFVMEESARRAAVAGTYTGGPISFNKYSGVQEWRNDALFLWINLGAPQCDVVNEFLDRGRQVTWFGGSRMTAQTRVIQRLVRVGECARLNNNDDNEHGRGIVLWCREYNASKRNFDPYVCFGRLGLSSYDPQSRPLVFVWNLLDYDKLVHHEEEHIRSTFQSILERNG